jgi:pimeloyl-ACP methyl ester carboxylesterase
MQKKIKSFDNTKINYEIIRKSDKFLIFLHGTGGELLSWRPYIKFFNKQGYSTIAIDMRGHGLSEIRNTDHFFSVENNAKDIHSIIEKEKIKNFILVGYCFGGMATMLHEKLFPDSSKGIVLIATSNRYPRYFQDSSLFVRFIRLFGIVTYDIWDMTGYLKKKVRGKYDPGYAKGDIISFRRVKNDFERNNIDNIIEVTKEAMLFQMKNLNFIKKPALVIQGTRDIMYSVKDAKRMHHNIKGSELRIIKNANHFLKFDRVDEICNYIDDFLNRRAKW